MAKITRALTHLDVLEELLIPFTSKDYYPITHRINHGLREQGWYLDGDPPDIPIEATLLIGDCLYNMRSALDHLVWQLVLLNGRDPSKQNAFPIFNDPDKYKKGKMSRLCGVSKSAIELIDSFQPYNSPNEPLWQLYKLSNADRHRHLHLVTTCTTRHVVKGNFDINSRFELKYGARGNFGAVHKGIELFAIKDIEVEIELYPTFEVAFSNFDPENRLLVYDTLNSMYLKVFSIMMDFDQLFPQFSDPSV